MSSTYAHRLAFLLSLLGMFVAGGYWMTTQAGEGGGVKTAGEALDAAVFGFTENAADGTAYGVRWAEPRKIRRLVAEFAPEAALPPADHVRVQYWHKAWDGKPEPVLREVTPCPYGWTTVDDWTSGQWRDADAKLAVDGRRWVFTFAATGRREFKDLGEPGVGYRKTLKIRLVCDRPMPRPLRLQALTDAVCRPLTVRIVWDAPAVPSLRSAGDQRGRLEAFNGAVLAVRPLGGCDVTVDRNMGWRSPAGKPGGIEADLLIASDPTDEQYDHTIVTVRTEQHPYSFDAAEVASGNRILVDDLGGLVTRGDDPITLAAYRQARKEWPHRTVYARVFDHPEQTLMGAWNDMPLRRQLCFVHGLPGNRNTFRQEPNGEVRIAAIASWFKLPKSVKDSTRKGWNGDFLTLDFGFPAESQRGGRELLEGYLPQLRTWWVDGPIYYEQTTLLDKLEPGLDNVRMDDPTVLLMRVRLVNTSAAAKGTARLRLSSSDTAGETLVVEGDRVLARRSDGSRLRYLFETGGRGTLAQAGNARSWSLELAPGESHVVVAMIPSVTLTKEAEIEALRRRDVDAASRRVCALWRRLSAQGAEIVTPEPWLNDFYKTHLRHMEVNCIADLHAPRRYAKVSSFGYGVFANESVMMITDLDRRGCHDMAEQCLQPWLDFQGTVALPGNFKTREGVFYGAGGWEHGGYNKHHGYVMWGMAEHWRYTRDRKWMEQSAAKLIKSCDWVTRERAATMTSNAQGTRPIHFGLLPAGSLEDVQDYWYWLATNACTAWGFQAVADALTDYGHPEAARLERDAKAYRRDVLRAFTEAKVRAPVVRLRDGTCVPKYPSEVYARGRSLGWIRETLEGSMVLLLTGLVPPNTPDAAWILKDYEDNLYISDLYGYSIPAFGRFWFSRGGFPMQANLLDGPLCYLRRDEVKHFLRAFFNGFASGFFPEIRMLSEHSNPELGYPAGDHFKTSDEAQVTYWLRLMFIHEQGDDLYVGQAIPRYWLANGEHVAIRRAATYFGPMSLEITSHVGGGTIHARLMPPERNRPKTIYLRLRHPEGKPIRSVTLNGRKYDRFDAGKEWIVLPGDLQAVQDVVASY
jgi:hypothetical protein